MSIAAAKPERSMNAFFGEFGHHKLGGLGFPPQFEGEPQHPPSFLFAIFFDQLLEASKLCLHIGVWRKHVDSVRETRTARCPLLHSAERFQLP